MKFRASVLIFGILLVSCLKSFSQDKKFYIFLCISQSNMEGNARIEPRDTIDVDPRFQVLEAVDCPDMHRIQGKN